MQQIDNKYCICSIISRQMYDIKFHFHLRFRVSEIFAVLQSGQTSERLSESHPKTCNTYTKSKAVPLQAWIGPDISRNLRFPDFMTTAQDGGTFVSLTHRPPLPPGNTPGSHSC